MSEVELEARVLKEIRDRIAAHMDKEAETGQGEYWLGLSKSLAIIDEALAEEAKPDPRADEWLKALAASVERAHELLFGSPHKIDEGFRGLLSRYGSEVSVCVKCGHVFTPGQWLQQVGDVGPLCVDCFKATMEPGHPVMDKVRELVRAASLGRLRIGGYYIWQGYRASLIEYSTRRDQTSVTVTNGDTFDIELNGREVIWVQNEKYVGAWVILA